MTYRETLDYLYSRLPMFQRVGAPAYKEGLENTLRLCGILGNPHEGLCCIHVAGTNGKGSVSSFLAAILQLSGYKTGLFTSPHLHDFRERIRINGTPVTEEKIINFTATHREAFERIQPSFFEMTAALAFDCFREEQTGIAVIETGMGGRLDSTNVITPVLSVITNIGLDHMQFLGDSMEKIAREKAGIIKEGIPAVIGETHPETENVFAGKAASCHAPLFVADRLFRAENIRTGARNIIMDVMKEPERTVAWHGLEVGIAGKYEIKNTITALCALEALRNKKYRISDENIRQGFRDVKKLTGFAGRWDILSESPLVICDCAHNPDGLKAVVSQLLGIKHDRLRIVLGMVKDKDYAASLSVMPCHALYYFCSPSVPRGLDADELRTHAATHGLTGNAFGSVREALTAATADAASGDIVFVGGSIFVAAEALGVKELT